MCVLWVCVCGGALSLCLAVVLGVSRFEFIWRETEKKLDSIRSVDPLLF